MKTWIVAITLLLTSSLMAEDTQDKDLALQPLQEENTVEVAHSPKLRFFFQPNEEGAQATWKGYVRRGKEKATSSGPKPLVTPGGGAGAITYLNPPAEIFEVSFKVESGGPSQLGKCEVIDLETGAITILVPEESLAEGEEVCFTYEYSPTKDVTPPHEEAQEQ